VRILVTGSSGFVGSHVVEGLLRAGHEVLALDRRPARPESPTSAAEHVLGDVRDPDLLDEAMRQVDLVCHQAAKVGLGVDVEDFPDYAMDNDVGTATVLAAMARRDVGRLVLASSMVVYGEGAYDCPSHGSTPAPPRAAADLESGRFDPCCPTCDQPLQPRLLDEAALLDPRNAYAASKVAQEHLAAAWARQTGGSVVALRYHNVYGLRMPRDTPYAGVASIFRSAIARGLPPEVYEDGAQRRDFVHVRDVAKANLAAAQALAAGTLPAGGLSAYNVGSGQVRTILDLADALTVTLGGPSPRVTGRYRLGDVRHITATSHRIATALGWRAEIEFMDGVTELAAEPPLTTS
jgi:dTDP-L-rhamnose 4-epimerase